MRLLQLNPNGTEESALDFHPMITIVTGLGATGHQLVIDAVNALGRGVDPGIGGLLETHGVMLDLNGDTVAMLDLGGERDVVIRSDEIPNAGGRASAASPGAATTRLSVEQFLEITPGGLHPELDAARQRKRDAAEALALLREAAERARRDHDEAVMRAERVAVQLDEARALAGDDGLSVGPSAAELADAGDVEARRAELEGYIEQLEEEVRRIDRGLDELSSIDTRPIQVLLEALRNPVPVELVPSERAAELADEFVRLQSRVAELEARLEEQGLGPASAMQRLDEARNELAAAERAMAKPNLSPEDVQELEAAHNEVLEAEQRVAGAFGKRHQKKLDDAMDKQQAVLDRVGFPTWSAYIMGANLLAIDPIAEQRLERAKFDLEAAETHWAAISQRIEADPEHGQLLDQLEAVYLEAFDLLGGDEPDDLESALRNLKVPKREVTTDELVDALAYQLELVGLDLGDNPTEDRATVVADAFLAEAASINERVEELRDQRRQVIAVLERTRYALQRLDDDAAAPTIDLTDTETSDTADDADDAEAEGPDEEEARHNPELDALEAELEVAREQVRDAADSLEAREALLDAATQVEAVATSKLMRIAAELAEQASAGPPETEPAFDVATRDADEAEPEAIEFYLLSRLAALRNISFAGSVPLLFDDAFASVDRDETRALLNKLERMADAVQIIYLSDDPTVVDWALEAGLERAAVVAAPDVFA